MKKKNALSYFGWLGLAGIAGIYLGTPVLWPFCLFFLFFSYRNTPADELFRENVRRAGLRAFAVGTAAGALSLLALFLRSSVVYRLAGPAASADGLTVTMEAAQWRQAVAGIALAEFTFAAALCTFALSLIWFGHREKEYLESDAG